MSVQRNDTFKCSDEELELMGCLQGFVEQCRRRSDLFPAARVQRLFGNIESIYALHCKFLRELELAFNQNIPESSTVGTVFLRNVCFNSGILFLKKQNNASRILHFHILLRFL